MNWKIEYTEDALRDLQNIFDYISLILLVPGIAAKQIDRIMDAADTLGIMPLRYRLYGEEPWRSQGLRILPVDNYIVFYLPDEVKNAVTIIRIMYKGRNIDKELSNPNV
jgi:toxin ParE1/3/4